MLAYFLTFAGLFALAGVCALAGLHPLAMAIFPAPVALCWVSRAYGRALGLVICAALAGFWGGGTVAMGIFYIVAAMIGVLMGVVMAWRWPFGWCVAAVTAAAYLLVAGNVLAYWEESRREASIFINARIAELEQADGETESVMASALAESFRWFDANWSNLSLGMLFGMVLLASTALVAYVARRLRGGDTGPTGSFSAMRLPEWVVWIAIALALLWFVDRRWPNDMLRLLAWNSAVGVAFVYWLNGFSILLHTMSAFSLNPFLCIAIIFGMFYLNAHPALCAVGLFDTWWDFRLRVARAAESRRKSRRPDDEA